MLLTLLSVVVESYRALRHVPASTGLAAPQRSDIARRRVPVCSRCHLPAKTFSLLLFVSPVSWNVGRKPKWRDQSLFCGQLIGRNGPRLCRRLLFREHPGCPAAAQPGAEAMLRRGLPWCQATAQVASPDLSFDGLFMTTEKATVTIGLGVLR